MKNENTEFVSTARIDTRLTTAPVQVTHNKAWAAYGRRVIRLKDGWMEK